MHAIFKQYFVLRHIVGGLA